MGSYRHRATSLFFDGLQNFELGNNYHKQVTESGEDLFDTATQALKQYSF